MASDWACALIPFAVVAKLQMDRRKKISVVCILGLGIFASIATCVRMPFLKYYNTDKYPTELLCRFCSWYPRKLRLTVIASRPSRRDHPNLKHRMQSRHHRLLAAAFAQAVQILLRLNGRGKPRRKTNSLSHHHPKISPTDLPPQSPNTPLIL